MSHSYKLLFINIYHVVKKCRCVYEIKDCCFFVSVSWFVLSPFSQSTKTLSFQPFISKAGSKNKNDITEEGGMVPNALYNQRVIKMGGEGNGHDTCCEHSGVLRVITGSISAV